MKKKFAIVFLSLFLVVSLPFAAHANIVTATGKYLINVVKKLPGATRVEATNTVTGAKHVINHGVSSSALATGIAAGVIQFGVSGGLSLAFQAITGLALDAVDWVMDKENNQIKWKKKGEGGVGYMFKLNGYSSPTYSTVDEACRAFVSRMDFIAGSGRHKFVSSSGSTCNYTQDGSPFSVNLFSAPADPDYKFLPLDTLAAKTIEQADAGQVDSQKTIEEYVTNLAMEGDLDAELDASTDITKPEGTEPEPKPDDPDKDCPLGTTKVDDICIKPSDPDMPLFCNSGDFTRKVCDWIDWTQEKPDDLKPDEGKVDVIDKSKDLTINENRIDFSNQCPAPTPINTSVGGFPISTELNYQPLCDFFVMLNPFVIGMGGISSALIIAGGIRRG